MSEEKTKSYLEDLVRYQYGDVAARLTLNEETAPFAKGALEKLVFDFGVDKGVLDGLLAGVYASEEGINTAIKIYAGKYQKALNDLDVRNFYELRAGLLKSLIGEEKLKEAKETFERYHYQSVGSIMKKFAQAQAILKDKTGLFDDEKKADAKKTIEKLTPIYSLITLLEQRNYEELKNSATKNTYKENILEALKKA